MAQMLSPGVYIEEVDASAIVPSVSANVAFFAGNFNSGPVDQPYVVTNRQEYADIFGTPTDRNYNEWYQGYKFFDYGNQLVITRGHTEALDLSGIVDIDGIPSLQTFTYDGVLPAPISPQLKVQQGDFILDANTANPNVAVEEIPGVDANGNPIIEFWDAYVYFAVPFGANVAPADTAFLGEYTVGGSITEWVDVGVLTDNDPFVPLVGATIRMKVRFDADPINILATLNSEVFYTLETDTSVGSNYIEIIINEPYNYKVSIGDVVAIGERNSVVPDPQSFGVVKNIKEAYITLSGGAIEKRNTLGIDFLFQATSPTSGSIFLVGSYHYNSATQAYSRGVLDVTNEPIDNNANNPLLNIDVKLPAGSDINGNPIFVENPNRLNYSYSLIKNNLDFDQQLSSGTLLGFEEGMKLKFISQSPSEGEIEIAIGNPYDFLTDQGNNENYAVAFYDSVNGVVTDNPIYLTTLFDYSPGEGQIAIAIKRGTTFETFIVSFDPNSVDGNFKNNYIENVLNEQSKLVYVVDNTTVNDVTASYLMSDREGNISRNLTLKGGRNPKVLGADLNLAYFSIEDKERFEIDVIIGNEEFPEGAINVALKRKDCIAYIGAAYEETVGFKANVATNKLLSWMKGESVEINRLSSYSPTRTEFAAFFANYFRIYDSYNKKYRWVNVAGDMAGIRCDVTSTNAPWWVSAGLKRGIIRNVNKLAFTPSQEQRDSLYKNSMNPIVSFPGTGNLVWGNKTLLSYASSFDRINVRTLFNTLERAMANAARSQVFEFNDPYTRNSMLSMFNPYLATIKAGRGIIDYLVVCDENNNTPDVISRNELRVDIYIKPNYAAEMILLTFTNVGTRSFADVVGV